MNWMGGWVNFCDEKMARCAVSCKSSIEHKRDLFRELRHGGLAGLGTSEQATSRFLDFVGE